MVHLMQGKLNPVAYPEVCFSKGKWRNYNYQYKNGRKTEKSELSGFWIIWIQLHCILAHRQGVSKCPMIYWVAISLWILFLHVFLQGSGGALHIHADKIDPQEEDGNTSCYASTFYSVHSSDILFCWLFEYSIIPTNWTISLQLISRWVHQEALKQCKPCKHVNRLCVN